MPKEISHIFFAEEIKKELPIEIQKIIDSNRHLYNFGSSSPDLFYYTLPSKKYHNLQKLDIGLRIHDDKQNLSPIYLLLKKAKTNETEKNKIFSFVCGYLTHVAVDTYFHPYIYSVTGHYFHTDSKKQIEYQTNHRLYETCLDLFLLNEFYKVSLKDFGLEKKLFLQKDQENILREYALSIFNSFFSSELAINENDFVGYSYYCYKIQKSLISLFLKKRLVNFLKRLPVLKQKAYLTALCYIDHPEYNQFDFWKFESIHPVNKKKISYNFFEISKLIQNRGKTFIKAAYQFLYTKSNSFSNLCKQIPHYSLNTGMIGISNTEMKYFNIHPVFRNA